MTRHSQPPPGAYAIEVGRVLRSLRTHRGLTMPQAIEAMRDRGVSMVAARLASYERGDRGLPAHMLDVIARGYGVPVWDLLPPDPRWSAPNLDRRWTDARCPL